MAASNEGAAQLLALGKRLRALAAEGDLSRADDLGQQFGAGKTLRAQLLAGIRAAAAPAAVAARAVARDKLPHRGGLNAAVAASSIKVVTRVSGSKVGVRIVARGPGRSSNRGVVRHPVFGHQPWVSQPIANPGWFDKTLEEQAPSATSRISSAMEAVANEVTRRT